MTLQRLRIPESNLHRILYKDQCALVAETLLKAGIDPESLIYCGIDGTDLVRARKLPVRARTWGVTYPVFQSATARQDEFGFSSVNDNPLQYAMQVELDRTPALITYTQSELTEVPNETRCLATRDRHKH